jgi:hypothetical protein
VFLLADDPTANKMLRYTTDNAISFLHDFLSCRFVSGRTTLYEKKAA